MILYFSGTGNSHYAARVLQRTLGGGLTSLNEKIRAGERGRFLPQEPLVIVVPTYAWRMPRVVEQWIRAAENTGSNPVWFVLTCGSDAGDAARYAEQLCRETGLEYRGLAEVVMPENYLAMFPVPDEETSERQLREAIPRLEQIAERIRAGETLEPPKSGLLRRLCSSGLNPGFYMTCVRARAFYATDACIGCGLCAQRCPLNNITLGEEGRPGWGSECTHCMACIGGCPKAAVEYGKRALGKRRYYLTKGPDE